MPKTEDRKYYPRLSVRITEEQEQGLLEICDWGDRIRLFGEIIDQLIIAYKQHGKSLVYGVLLKKIKLFNLNQVKEDLKDGGLS